MVYHQLLFASIPLYSAANLFHNIVRAFTKIWLIFVRIRLEPTRSLVKKGTWRAKKTDPSGRGWIR